MRCERQRLISGGSVLVRLGVVDELLDEDGDVVSPALRQAALAAVSWFSASSRSVKRGCGWRATAGAFALLA